MAEVDDLDLLLVFVIAVLLVLSLDVLGDDDVRGLDVGVVDAVLVQNRDVLKELADVVRQLQLGEAALQQELLVESPSFYESVHITILWLTHLLGKNKTYRGNSEQI